MSEQQQSRTVEPRLKDTSTHRVYTDHKREWYPNLTPHRALINLEREELIRFAEAPAPANVDCGRPSMGAAYNIADDWVVYTVDSVPQPNQHGEVPVVNTAPQPDELIKRHPRDFQSEVLENGGETPFVILERPPVLYEEAHAGTTWEVLGWYWPYADDIDDRVRPLSEMETEFPALDGTLAPVKRSTEFRYLPGLDVRVEWDDVEDPDDIRVAFGRPGGGQLFGKVVSPKSDLPFTLANRRKNEFGTFDIDVDSPKHLKPLIKQYDDADHDVDELGWEEAHPSWDGENEVWVIDGDAETIQYAIRHFTDQGEGVIVEGSIVEAISQTTWDYEVVDEPLGEPADDLIDDELLVEAPACPHTEPHEPDLRQEFPSEDAFLETSLVGPGEKFSISDDATFTHLDTLLAEHTITISVSNDFASNIPPSLTNEWTPSLSDAEYSWYNPETGDEVRVETKVDTEHPDERTVWGGEAMVDVADRDDIDGDEAAGVFEIVSDEARAEEPEVIGRFSQESLAVAITLELLDALSNS